MVASTFSLVNSGLYPEVLPPCFDSSDAERAFHGIVGKLNAREFHKRDTAFIRYSGTKHDGARRFFGTPNIVSYFFVSRFIRNNWRLFERKFSQSSISIGKPIVLGAGSERALKVPSLSDLSLQAAKKIRYAPYILKVDIAQFYSSVYTHSLPWAAHGKQASREDRIPSSKSLRFNAFDHNIQACQSGQTRGVLIGPDGFRLAAEFLSCEIDRELESRIDEHIVGAVRHVDDYYIGLKSEIEAPIVLSKMRELLAEYELYVNDSKTTVLHGLTPINDLWAQKVRAHVASLRSDSDFDQLDLAFGEVFAVASQVSSASPIKMLLRRLDNVRIYSHTQSWESIEPYLQRLCFSYPHAVDYAFLLAVKRRMSGGDIDVGGWQEVAERLLARNIPLRHHHEIVWCLWLMISLRMNLSEELISAVVNLGDDHSLAMLFKAHSDGVIHRRPRYSFAGGLSSESAKWLSGLVARSEDVTRSRFSGTHAQEFEHLAKKRIKLIDFEKPLAAMREVGRRAISRVRYGYDDDDDDDQEFPEVEDFDGFDGEGAF